MTYFDANFRLRVFFSAFLIYALFVNHVINAVQLSSQNAEKNSTQNPSLLSLRHNWESPSISMAAMNHNWHNNDILRFGNTRAAAVPLAGGTTTLKKETQQTSLLTQNNLADMIASSVARFAINVGSELSTNAFYSKSEVFSPLSIMSALALLFAGAKGQTYEQLKPIFGYDQYKALSNDPNFPQMLHREFGALLQDIEQEHTGQMQHRNNAKWRDTITLSNIRSMALNQKPIVHIIKVANGLFAQNGYNLNPNYRNVISSIYRSELAMLDFHGNGEAARQHINAWVSKNTFGKIPNIITNAIPQSTNMILASVLYFKGFWENTFFEAATALDNFYPDGEGKPGIKVQMMATGGVFPFYDAPEYDCRIIGLPYRGNLTTMYVIQPNYSSREKLKDFQSKITPEAIDEMISKMAHRTAVMAFPKLHLVRQLNLKEVLQRFGVIDIFTNGASDLSLIGSPVASPLPSAVNKVSNILQNRPWPVASAIHSTTPEHGLMDRYNERPLFFSSRWGEIGNTNKINATNNDKGINVKETTTVVNNVEEETTMTTVNDEESITTTPMPITTPVSAIKNQTNEKSRSKRQIPLNNPLSLLEAERLTNFNGPSQSDLYVEDVLHKVDFEVNEQGTEAAAATLTYLRRSGTDIVFRADTPFMLLLRHDPTNLVLFYAIVNEPET